MFSLSVCETGSWCAWVKPVCITQLRPLLLCIDGVSFSLATMHLFSQLVSLVLLVTLALQASEGRIRYKYRQRSECKEEWPRRPEDLKIVLSAVIQQMYPPTAGAVTASASAFVRWVLKGPTQLEGTRITVDGFGSGSCSPVIRSFDSLILILEESVGGLFRLNGTIIRVNLNNIERMQAIVADVPYRKRGEIPDLPCEAAYCSNNADCAMGTDGRTSCHCPTSCRDTMEPVCGSNRETFASECRMRADSCVRSENVFVRHPGRCDDVRDRRSLLLPFLGVGSH